jgi:cellulose synthase/poly-beta-1,6-N-acetylglucosamine synthase-like glycosyltransferase
MPPVSVLLPCFNAEMWLPEALESLAGQTLTDFELVAVNDGSDDATGDILHEWAARDARIRVLTRPHAGIITALNAGLEACSSRYIARMDADDRSYPDRLACQVAFLDAHSTVDVVSCQVKGFPAGQVREGFRIYIEWLNSLIEDANIRREIFVESPLVHPSVIFRRECVQQVGGYQEHGWPEDYDLWLRLYLAGAHFARLPEVLFEWRERPDRMTRTDQRYSLENFLRAKAHYLKLGPLADRDAVIIWGAGMMGRRLSRQLQRQCLPLTVFVDVDWRKIGHTRRGLPIIPVEELLAWWGRFKHPALLAAVGARGARPLIRQQLAQFCLQEGQDWWFAA